jgi:hypothetical protein
MYVTSRETGSGVGAPIRVERNRVCLPAVFGSERAKISDGAVDQTPEPNTANCTEGWALSGESPFKSRRPIHKLSSLSQLAVSPCLD